MMNDSSQARITREGATSEVGMFPGFLDGKYSLVSKGIKYSNRTVNN